MGTNRYALLLLVLAVGCGGGGGGRGGGASVAGVTSNVAGVGSGGAAPVGSATIGMASSSTTPSSSAALDIVEGPNPPAASSPKPGAKQVPAAQVHLVASSDVKIQSVTVRASGTATPSDVASIDIIIDADGDGAFDPSKGDVLLASAPLAAGAATFAAPAFPAQTLLGGASVDVVALVTFAPGAAPGATLSLSLGAADVDAIDPMTGTAVVAQGKVSGATLTVAAQSATPPATTPPTTTPPTTTTPPSTPPPTAPPPAPTTASGAFSAASSLAQARGLASATTLDDGRVLVVGGYASAAQNKVSFAAESELYDPLADAWTTASKLTGKNGLMRSTFGLVTVKRAQHTATKLADGRILIAGGYGVEKKAFLGLGPEIVGVLESAHVFDPRTNKFASTGAMKYPRYGHTATLLADGRVLIAGGYSPGFFNTHATLAPVEIFDPKNGKFSVPTNYLVFQQKTAEKRQDHAALALDNGGAVLLVGGQHYGLLGFKLSLSETGEVYSGGQFTSVGKLVKPRRFPAVAPFAGGAVVLGGDDLKNPIGDVEVFDRNTGKFAARATLATPRTHAAAARTSDYALCIGGFAPGAGEVGNVEAFDGSRMLPGLSLATPRNGAAVAELKDGRVLVVGGFTGGVKDVRSLDGQAIASCEVYSK